MALHRIVDGEKVYLTKEEEAQLIAEWEANYTEKLATQYIENRKAAYPPIGDQLDALWKAFAIVDPATLPAETVAVLDQIEAVKVEYPKPIEPISDPIKPIITK